MKPIWIILVAILVALSVALGFYAGSLWQHRLLVAFSLKVDLVLYHAADRGDLASLKQQLGTVLVARTRTYRALFPNPGSSKTFLEAEQVSRDIERKQGPLIEVPFHQQPN